jgi:histidine ammonia-lyase
LQQNLLRSHACGVGDPLDIEIVRAMMLIRANVLAKGLSGIRPVIAERLCDLLNRGVTPVVPSRGSVGASGDLAPLAHTALVLTGEGEAWYQGRELSGAEALRAAGIEPVELQAKEGISLVNGTQAMLAIGTLALLDLEDLCEAADVACALSLDALRGTPRAFDPRVHDARPHPGQQASAAHLTALLTGSQIRETHATCPRVQDAYSLRCAPQVHGAARDVLAFCRQTVEREMASVVDNPVVLADRGALFSTGNFHGQALAYAADMVASLAADTAAISERRTNRLLDPSRSRGLPAFLSPEPGLNSGLMMAQYTAASCVTQLRQTATPYAVQSLDTSGGQEDHVSMGFAAALRSRRSLELLRQVVAVELVCAAQALELRAPLHTGPATGALLASLRGRVPHLDADRPLAPDLEATAEWLRGGEWRQAVESAVGPLV